jgi:hypothetical protein
VPSRAHSPRGPLLARAALWQTVALVTDLKKRMDPRSFPLLGLLTAAACGPASPAGETDATTNDGTSTEGVTADPTTDPTDPTGPTSTDPSTGEPPPECRLDSDCEFSAYCNQCYEGSCRMNPDCDERPYNYDDDCYDDRDCDDGYVCARGQCVEAPPIALPSCVPPDVDIVQWNLSNAPSSFVLADLDGDLDLDIAAAEPASGSIEIALNDGAGKFILAGAFAIAPEGTGELALAAGDIDKDGDLDLVVTRREVDGVLNLLFNDGAVFTVGPPNFIAEQPVQVFMADMNGDGALDVVSVNEVWPHVTVQIGDGAGKLSAKQTGIAPLIKGRAHVGDITLDGVADLLAPVSGEVTLWVGGLQPLLVPLRDFPVAGSDMVALTADLDLQGHSDLVLIHADGDKGMLDVWSSTAKDAWAFEPQNYVTSQPLTGGVLAELDDLAGPDLVSATKLGQLMILPGNGGGFACEHIVVDAATSSPALIAVGDVDDDGRPDIIAGGLDGPTLTTIHLAF